MKRSEIAQQYLKALDLHNPKLDLKFLSNLTRRHVAIFAFSSVGCRLREDLPLDLNSLYQRIVVQRRGGYCFEQNGLLYEILEELGFSIQLYLARVIYNQTHHPGLTHRITVVELHGRKYITDVGFGSLGPRIPVLISENESKDDDRTFRVTEPRKGDFHMQVLKDGSFFSLYRFEFARYGQADCEVGHFFSHKHPKASFVNHLVVSRILKSEIRSLRDLTYWVITESGTQEVRIDHAFQLRKILIGKFGIQVTEEESRQLYKGSLQSESD